MCTTMEFALFQNLPRGEDGLINPISDRNLFIKCPSAKKFLKTSSLKYKGVGMRSPPLVEVKFLITLDMKEGPECHTQEKVERRLSNLEQSLGAE